MKLTAQERDVMIELAEALLDTQLAQLTEEQKDLLYSWAGVRLWINDDEAAQTCSWGSAQEQHEDLQADVKHALISLQMYDAAQADALARQWAACQADDADQGTVAEDVARTPAGSTEVNTRVFAGEEA